MFEMLRCTNFDYKIEDGQYFAELCPAPNS